MACLRTQCTNGRARSQGSCDCLHCHCLQSQRLPDCPTSHPFRYHPPRASDRSTLLSFGQYGPLLQMSTFLRPCGPPPPYLPHVQSTMLVPAALRTFPFHPLLLWSHIHHILQSWLHGSHHAITSSDPCRAGVCNDLSGVWTQFLLSAGVGP